MNKKTVSIRFFVSLLPEFLLFYQKKLDQFKEIEAIHPLRETRRF